MTKRTCCILTAALLACSALAVRAQEAKIQEAADKILRRLAEKHAPLQTHEGTVSLTAKVTLGGQTRTEQLKMAFRLAKPNKLRAELKTQGTTLAIACDGENAWIHHTGTNKYLVQEAPEDWHEFFSRPEYAVFLMDMTRVVFGPLSRNPYAALVKDLEGAELVGSEKLGPAEADHIVLHLPAGDMDVWVDRASLRIIKARMNPKKHIEEQKARDPRFADLSIVFEAVLEPTIADADKLPDSFVFKPPQDVRQVRGMQELFEVDLTGQPMRDFRLEGLAEGTTWHLAEHKGKVIALDFWATWCPPCRAELPVLAEIYKEYKGRGFLLLAVNQQEDRAKVAAFLKETNLDVPVALDSTGQVGATYMLKGLPTLVLIGKDGIVQAVHTGYGPGAEKTIRRDVEKLLAGEPLGGD